MFFGRVEVEVCVLRVGKEAGRRDCSCKLEIGRRNERDWVVGKGSYRSKDFVFFLF